ncbi:hypothetical protein QBC46DRAFT_244127, partial [Diplogelasinospora grovesii]
RSDFHRHPPRPTARRQRHQVNRGTDHQELSIQLLTRATAIFADSARVRKRLHCWASRISSHQPGWDQWL